MFYFGTILLAAGLIKIGDIIELFANYQLYPYYNTFELTDFWIGLILTALGLIGIIKGWDKPHKHTLMGRIYTIFLFIMASRTLLDSVSIDEYTLLNIFGRIVNLLAFVIPGVLTFVYNEKKISVPHSDSVQQIPVEPVETEPYEFTSDIGRLNYKLKQVFNTDYVLTHPNFKKKLNHSIALLDQMDRDDYEIDQDFLEQISKLSDFYLDIEDNQVQTLQSQATLEKIADTFDTIDEALENIYDKNFSLQVFDIEGDIIAMKAKLNMNGALDSPFEKFKKEQIKEAPLDE